MNEFIGISEDRLHHILGVARECYQIAKNMGESEDNCRRMFIIGWLHDVGYEFSEQQSEHPEISAEMLTDMFTAYFPFTGQEDYFKIIDADAVKTIREHGRYYSAEYMPLSWKILNIADLTIDSKGNKVDVMQRLDDIKNRYGEYSNQYLTACDNAVKVGLVDRNSINRNQFGE